MAVLAKALAVVAFEVERGGIEKDQTELAEQVVAQGEQPLLDEILGGARTNAAPALVGKLLAEPAHRPVKLVQLETRDNRRSPGHGATSPRRGRSRGRTGGGGQ
jgi:hypothetical protein